MNQLDRQRRPTQNK